MKKLIGVSMAIALSVGSFAQNDQIQNSKDVDIMPVAGDIGIGMNAIPIFNYLGDIFGLSGNNTSLDNDKFVSYFGQQSLFGKYMLTDDNAIRVNLRVGHTTLNSKAYSFDDTALDPDTLVEDRRQAKKSDFNVGIGYEFRRGKTRLRGIYGGEILWSLSKQSESYEYGNAFGNGNPAPTSTIWGGSMPIASSPLGSRITASRSGTIQGLGLRVFGGIEYYIAPKICFGTEFGWSIGGAWQGEGTQTFEYWNPLATDASGNVGAVMDDESTGFSTNSFSMDTDNFNGALYLMFWF